MLGLSGCARLRAPGVTVKTSFLPLAAAVVVGLGGAQLAHAAITEALTLPQESPITLPAPEACAPPAVDLDGVCTTEIVVTMSPVPTPAADGPTTAAVVRTAPATHPSTARSRPATTTAPSPRTVPSEEADDDEHDDD